MLAWPATRRCCRHHGSPMLPEHVPLVARLRRVMQVGAATCRTTRCWRRPAKRPAGGCNAAGGEPWRVPAGRDTSSDREQSSAGERAFARSRTTPASPCRSPRCDLHQTTHLPSSIDPSHGTAKQGAWWAASSDRRRRRWADLEVHPDPEKALSDGPSLTPKAFSK